MSLIESTFPCCFICVKRIRTNFCQSISKVMLKICSVGRRTNLCNRAVIVNLSSMANTRMQMTNFSAFETNDSFVYVSWPMTTALRTVNIFRHTGNTKPIVFTENEILRNFTNPGNFGSSQLRVL